MHEVNLIDDWLERTRNLVSGSGDKGLGAVIAWNETCHDVKADLICSLLCAAVSIKDGATSTGVEQDRCGY